ncbi:GIY-YIG nuclease family protein [Candidatus Parcubacteria bacterium]|nr:GIY-YIG nuclease family protein [Candidatus Parcubacteria bacterium]
MKFTTYILLSEKTNQYYIGSTNDINRRFKQHNDQMRKSWASKRAPWKLIFQQNFSSRSEAMRLERHLKSFKNRTTLMNYVGGKVSR